MKKGHTMFKKKAFSMAEVIILVVVLAVAVASTMPIISRKLVNNAMEGSALGGGTHGRYEIYVDPDDGLPKENIYSGTHLIVKERVIKRVPVIPGSETTDPARPTDPTNPDGAGGTPSEPVTPPSGTTPPGGTVIDPVTGEIIVKVPNNTRNLIVHGVGGGGAGGGLNGNFGKVLTPGGNGGRDNAIIKKELMRIFDLVIKDIPYYGPGKPNFDDYVQLNNNGTITVRADITTSILLYHQLIQATVKLGSQSQAPELTPMPKWFDWSYFSNSGYLPFGLACGTAGAQGSGIHWDTNPAWDDIQCMRDALMPHPSLITNELSNPHTTCGNQKDCKYNTTETQEVEECDDEGKNCKKVEKDVTVEKDGTQCTEATCVYSLNDSNECYDYGEGIDSNSRVSYLAGQGKIYVASSKDSQCEGSYVSPSSCLAPDNSTNTKTASAASMCGSGCLTAPGASRTKELCGHYYSGAPGGAAPPCVKLTKKTITGPFDMAISCAGHDPAQPGPIVYTTAGFGTKIVVGEDYRYGDDGLTCTVVVDNATGTSVGGEGGCPYVAHMQLVPRSVNVTRGGSSGSYDFGALDTSLKYSNSCGRSNCSTFTDRSWYFLTERGWNTFRNSLGFARSYQGDSQSAFSGFAYLELSQKTMCLALQTDSEKCKVADGSVVFGSNDVGNGTGTGGSGKGSCPSGYICEEVPQGSNSYPTGRYNYKYVWTIPFAMNQLGYGEGGGAGEYVSVKLSSVTGDLKIKVGEGGQWSPNKWQTSSNGPKGGDTIVKMQNANGITNKTVLKAKGGEGGSGGYLSSPYIFCWGNDQTRACGNGTPCCSKELMNKNTDEINATHVKDSGFSSALQAVAKDSLLIPKSFGNSGHGSGSIPYDESGNMYGYTSGERYITNLTAPSASGPTSQKIGQSSERSNIQVFRGKNTVTKNPEDIDMITGKPGAVVIIW